MKKSWKKLFFYYNFNIINIHKGIHTYVRTYIFAYEYNETNSTCKQFVGGGIFLVTQNYNAFLF